MLYQEDPDISTHTNGSSKRKRAEHVHEDDEEQEDSQDSEEESEDERPKKTKGKAKARKPANKKPKTARVGMKLAMRPAVNGSRQPSRAKKSHPHIAEIEDGSLYGKPADKLRIFTNND